MTPFTLIDDRAGDALRAVHAAVVNLQLAVADLKLVAPCRLVGDRRAIARSVYTLLEVFDRIDAVVGDGETDDACRPGAA